MSAMSLTKEELTAWSRHVHEICGVYLDESKAYLIETRLAVLLRDTGAAGWSDFLARLKADSPSGLRIKVINAITTNETSFFRDGSPFEMLRHKFLPELIDRRTRSGYKPVPLRILSAACSTGQEIYTTAMVLKELLGDFRGYDIRLLGLDISDAAIAQASYARYTRLELDRGLSPEMMAKFFEPDGERFKIRDELRTLASFRRANLLDPISVPCPFDLIFCRNVAIYFNEADKIRLFRNLGRVLAKDGALVIGSTETIGGLCPEFEPQRHVRSIYYTKSS